VSLWTPQFYGWQQLRGLRGGFEVQVFEYPNRSASCLVVTPTAKEPQVDRESVIFARLYGERRARELNALVVVELPTLASNELIETQMVPGGPVYVYGEFMAQSIAMRVRNVYTCRYPIETYGTWLSIYRHDSAFAVGGHRLCEPMERSCSTK
jgi:hypothetical protein